MASKKRNQKAAKKARAKASKRASLVREEAVVAPPSQRPSTAAAAGTPPRRSSVLQGFSHQVTPRQSGRLSGAVDVAIGGVATAAAAEAVEEAERVLAAEVYKAPPVWFDGADYDVNDDGEIIGVAARRFAASIERAEDDESAEEEEEIELERPSLLSQRRSGGLPIAKRSKSSPSTAAGQKRQRAPSLPSSLSPLPRFSDAMNASRLQDPFLERDTPTPLNVNGAAGTDKQKWSPRASKLEPPPVFSATPQANTKKQASASQQRRSGALAPEAQPLFFHHFDTMTPVRVRLGVVPLPSSTRASRSHEEGDGYLHPRLTFVERFLNPRKFFQLPSASPSEPPVDILGWAGVYSELPVWLPATTPDAQERFAKRARHEQEKGTRDVRAETVPEHAPAPHASSPWWSSARDQLGRLVGKVTRLATGTEPMTGRSVTTIDTAASVTVVLSP